MQMTKYFTVDKSEYGPGPWQDEPDRVDWIDPETGYFCTAMRNSHTTGAWCGYVGVDTDHPAYNSAYDDLPVDVHGGLTWAGPITNATPALPDGLYFLGFDCAHAGDISPKMLALMKGKGLHLSYYADETYRSLPYVMQEITSLAKQLKG